MVWVNLLIGVFTIAVVIYSYFKWSYQYWKRKNVPYIEPTVPFGSFKIPFGDTPGMVAEMKMYYEKAKKNKWDYLGLYNLGSPWLLVTNLDQLKNIITKDFNHFTGRGEYVNEKDQPISGHLFSLEGNKWRNIRVKLSPTFTSGKMKMMFDIVAKCGVLFEQYINEVSGQKDGIDIKNALACFTTDTISSVAFGLESNCLKEPNSPFRVYSKKLFDINFVDMVKILTADSFPNMSRTLGIVTMPREVEKFFNDIVKEAVEYREKNNVKRKDFLQLLIDIKNSSEGRDAGDGTTLTIDEIVAQCFVFFLGGFETSSTTMTFALFELATNQEIQDKVREEVQRVLYKYDGQITYDSLIEMTYLQQVIDETLRMYAPIPFLTRVANEEYKLPGTDLVIDKGVKVIIDVQGIHYDEDIYENPNTFDPERFSAEKKNSRHNYSFLPFGEGPRVCIGMRFGIMQTKIGLVTVLKKHRVILNSKTQVPLKFDPVQFIPNAIGGIWLDIEKIN